MASTKPTSTDIAWAAGLFEGEGHFTLRERANSRAYLELGITSTDQDVVERWADVFEINIRRKRWRQDQPHWKPQFVSIVSGAQALAIAEAMRPYLGTRRTKRLNDILTVVDASEPKERQCECCGKKFTPTRWRTLQRFCTIACADKAKYLRRRYGTPSAPEARSRGYGEAHRRIRQKLSA